MHAIFKIILLLALRENYGVKCTSNTQDRGKNFETHLFQKGNISVGKTIDLFPNYGLAAFKYKVFPNQDELFTEKTRQIFYPGSYNSKNIMPVHAKRDKTKYNDYFLIDFCDTMEDLLRAYFDQFHVDGIPMSHKVFTSLLSLKEKSSYLGILPHFFDNRHSFVLVRLYKRERKESLTGNKKLLKELKRDLKTVRTGSRNSARKFLEKYGTHVITEYEIGDVMYQVFVFNNFYKELKNNFASDESEDYLNHFEQYFSPYYALHVGDVKLASGNENFTSVIAKKLESSYSIYSIYQSIFRIFDKKNLEKELETLKGEVILGMKMKKITSELPKGLGRRRLSEVLDNTLTLYYVNL